MYDRCLDETRVLPYSVSPTLISMADQPSSTAAKKSKEKGGGIVLVELFRDVIKPPKLANYPVENQTRVSVPFAVDAHESITGNDAGSAEPTASS